MILKNILILMKITKKEIKYINIYYEVERKIENLKNIFKNKCLLFYEEDFIKKIIEKLEEIYLTTNRIIFISSKIKSENKIESKNNEKINQEEVNNIFNNIEIFFCETELNFEISDKCKKTEIDNEKICCQTKKRVENLKNIFEKKRKLFLKKKFDENIIDLLEKIGITAENIISVSDKIKNENDEKIKKKLIKRYKNLMQYYKVDKKFLIDNCKEMLKNSIQDPIDYIKMKENLTQNYKKKKTILLDLLDKLLDIINNYKKKYKNNFEKQIDALNYLKTNEKPKGNLSTLYKYKNNIDNLQKMLLTDKNENIQKEIKEKQANYNKFLCYYAEDKDKDKNENIKNIQKEIYEINKNIETFLKEKEKEKIINNQIKKFKENIKEYEKNIEDLLKYKNEKNFLENFNYLNNNIIPYMNDCKKFLEKFKESTKEASSFYIDLYNFDINLLNNIDKIIKKYKKLNINNEKNKNIINEILEKLDDPETENLENKIENLKQYIRSNEEEDKELNEFEENIIKRIFNQKERINLLKIK